jgi:phage FluMu gp28-like protein
MLVAGLDIGRHKDPTVLCVLDIGHLPWKLVRFISLAKRSWDFHVEQLTLQLDKVNHTVADATGVGDAIYQRLPNCWGAVLVSKVSRPKIRGDRVVISVGFAMKAMYEKASNRNLVIACEAPGLREQLQRFQVKLVKDGRLRYEGAKNSHDDAVFALALATVAGILPDRPRRDQIDGDLQADRREPGCGQPREAGRAFHSGGGSRSR